MKTIHYLALFIAIVVVNNIIWFTPKLASPYYLVMLAALLLCLALDTKIRFNFAMSCLYAACALSILANDIPEFFNPWIRLATFIIVSALASPFVESPTLCQFRVQAFRYIQWGILGVVLFSFIGRFLGFARNQGTYFMGITTHSMTLGPLASMALLFLLYLYFNNQLPVTKWRRWMMFGLMPISGLLVLMAASRTSFFAMMVSVLFFLCSIGRQRLGKMLKWLLAAGCLAMLTLPLWNQYLDEGLKQKNQGSLSELNLDSRSAHWQQRINEFKSSPILGIGFASVDTEAEASTVGEEGKVETGSSWLMMLSMTGAVGFLSFLLLFYQSIKSALAIGRQQIVLSGYLLSLLVFWSIHMLAEGYIFGAGGFLFFNVWLLFGVIQSLHRSPILCTVLKGNYAKR